MVQPCGPTNKNHMVKLCLRRRINMLLQDFVLLFESQSNRGKDGHWDREISSTHSFTHQMIISARADPIQSLEPVIPSGSPTWVPGTQTFRSPFPGRKLHLKWKSWDTNQSSSRTHLAYL